MKRTLHKRAGLWEISVPLRAPVRGIWRYTTFAEAWGHLWRAGYPPGLPGEIKMAVRNTEPSRLGIDYLADIDDAVRGAFDSTNDLVAVGIAVPQQLKPAEPAEVKRDPPEPLTFPATPLIVPSSSRPRMPDFEVPVLDTTSVKNTSADVVSEPARAPVLPVEEPRPHASSWTLRAIAIGLGIGLTIFLVTLLWPVSHGGSDARPSVADSAVPGAAFPASKPAEVPTPPPASDAGKLHASIRTTDRSWITACGDGKIVFSKLFTTGSQDSVDFIDHAVVRMGDAGPVEITLDGKPVGPLGRTGQVRVIELVRGTSHFLTGGGADDCTVAKAR